MNPRLFAVSSLVLGLGAGAMYFFDPDRGRRRRAMLGDQWTRLSRKSEESAEKTARDATNRFQGLFYAIRYTIRSLAQRWDSAPDDLLEARVRSRLGSVVRHPRSIEVHARDGQIFLEGPVLADEVEDLIEAVSEVHGARQVKNLLTVYDRPDDIPGLQGEGRLSWQRQQHVLPVNTPTARFLTGTAGAALALFGLRLQNRAGSSMAMLGLGLLANAIAGSDVMRPPKLHS